MKSGKNTLKEKKPRERRIEDAKNEWAREENKNVGKEERESGRNEKMEIIRQKTRTCKRCLKIKNKNKNKVTVSKWVYVMMSEYENNVSWVKKKRRADGKRERDGIRNVLV